MNKIVLGILAVILLVAVILVIAVGFMYLIRTNGAFWDVYCGISGGTAQRTYIAYQCNFHTSDAGKVCNTGAECQGYCTPYKAEELMKGRCSEWKKMWGCTSIYYNGTISGICID